MKFKENRGTRRFVGLVSHCSKEEITIKFARRIDDRFKWPEVDDISIVDLEQIESRLDAPKLLYRNDRLKIFEFKYKLPADVQ